MRIRIWKDGTWRWRIRRPGYTLSGPAPSWAAAMAAGARELRVVT